MPPSRIIVIGASAGGVEALKGIAAALPEDLKAAVFVVLHIGVGMDGKSYLPNILSKAGPLPAVHAADGDRIQDGAIYVARPDCHLLIEDGLVLNSPGPKENMSRPAINPLFRSAARAHGDNVIGVLLTGMLDDGTAGLAEIKREGGLAIVEDPHTAQFPSMPSNALKFVKVDFVSPLADIPRLLTRLVSAKSASLKMEESMQKELSGLTCPECRGPLSEQRQGAIVEYSCRVGHVYSPLTLARGHRDTVERAVWSAIVALEEAADIAGRLAPELGEEYVEEAKRKRAVIDALKKSM